MSDRFQHAAGDRAVFPTRAAGCDKREKRGCYPQDRADAIVAARIPQDLPPATAWLSSLADIRLNPMQKVSGVISTKRIQLHGCFPVQIAGRYNPPQFFPMVADYRYPVHRRC